MKTPRVLLFSAFALANVGAVWAAEKAKEPSPVEVTYVDAEKFTDVRDGFYGTDAGRENTLNLIKEHLVKQAARELSAGQKLTVTFTDIDLAGDYEPWRSGQWADVRIVKDIYPPRMVFTFRLTGADGKVIKEEKRDLRDMAFMMKITMGFRDDPLRHEKALLDDWLSEEFRALKKS